MAAGEGVRGVDIGIAGGTQGGGVGLAEERGWGPLAGLAHPDTLVTGSQLIGCMDLGVAAGT